MNVVLGFLSGRTMNLWTKPGPGARTLEIRGRGNMDRADPADGGELVLYQNDEDTTGIRVTPALGTVVLFLSEEFPHEVKPASQNRFSIAGWYRVNTSIGNKIDPPK